MQFLSTESVAWPFPAQPVLTQAPSQGPRRNATIVRWNRPQTLFPAGATCGKKPRHKGPSFRRQRTQDSHAAHACRRSGAGTIAFHPFPDKLSPRGLIAEKQSVQNPASVTLGEVATQ